MTRYKRTARRLRHVILFTGILYTLAALLWVVLPLFSHLTAAVFGDDFEPAGFIGVPFPLPMMLLPIDDWWSYAFSAAFLVGLVLLAQWAFLRPGRAWTARLAGRGRPMKSAVISAGAMAMLLTVGFVALLLELPNWWEPVIDETWSVVGLWIVMLPLWGAWAWVFFLYCRKGDHYTQLSRLARALVAGSIAEALVATPVHIWATRQRECYCARGTYTTLIFAGTVLLWVFGPGIILLYMHERHRRSRLFQVCERCGYDLTGNESGACPECGTETVGAETAPRDS